jgi:CRISPR-associated protein Csd1
MILKDLCDLYDLKRESHPESFPQLHWCLMNVRYEIDVSEEGEVISCIPLVDEEGNNGRRIAVPMAYVAKSGTKPKPGFLCDDAQHVFGVGEKKYCDELRKMHVELHEDILGGINDAGAQAYLAMLRRYPRGNLPPVCREALSEDTNSKIVFRLVGDNCLLCEREAIKNAWNSYATAEEQQQEKGVCLVSGRIAPRAILFPQVTGLKGAHSAGASLVSCNEVAFCSYGQEKNTAGPISEVAAEKAGTALSYVLKDSKHHVQFGTDYVCFWTDSTNPVIDDCIAMYVDPDRVAEDNAIIAGRGEDVTVRDAVQKSLRNLVSGRPPIDIPPDTRYFIMGIAPYKARLSVRFYEVGSFGELQRNVRLFLQDTEMVGAGYSSLRLYLEQACAQGDRKSQSQSGSKNLPRPLITSSFRALIRGTAFPEALLRELVLRTRVDHGSRTRWDMGVRAAMLKACLIRKSRLQGKPGEVIERGLTVALNEENTNQGYLLGRLFALLEKVQSDAVGNVNSGIRDRYMGAASTTPARVFPQLLKLAQHHISKSEYGMYIDRLAQQVISGIDDEGFPRTLSYDDQGEFYIGYYQQKEALYTKKSNAAAVDVEAVEERN